MAVDPQRSLEMAMAAILVRFEDLLERAQSNDAGDQAWAEIYEVFDRLARGSEAWRKVMADAGEMIARPRLLLLMDRLGADIVEVIEGLPLSDEARKDARRALAVKMAVHLNSKRVPALLLQSSAKPAD